VLTFEGGSANTYSGNTIVNAGTLSLAKTTGVTSVPSHLFIGDGVDGDAVFLSSDNQIANTANVMLAPIAVLELNGHSDTIGALSLQGSTVFIDSGTLTLGGNVTNLAG